VLIGRSPSCDVVLEDVSVSREHARISANDTGVVIEDLSTNGVFIDGVRINGWQMLRHDAMITIGRHQLDLVVDDDDRFSPPTIPEPPESFQVEKPTLAASSKDVSSRSGARPAPRVSTAETDAIALLGGVAERLIAEGRGLDAERLMTARMNAILEEAQRTNRIAPDAATATARMAVKLAAATAKQSWVEYAFAVSTIGPHALPIELVDELYNLVRRLPPMRIAVLRDYIAALSENSGKLSPSERFVLQRLRGFAKLALTLGTA